MSIFDLDTRTVDADAIKQYRASLDLLPHESDHWRHPGYPSLAAMAARIGVQWQTFSYWERNGICAGTSAAMWRLWRDERVTFDSEATVSADELGALVSLCGGPGALADELGVGGKTVRAWIRDGVSKRVQPLLRWLCDEMAGAIDEIMEAA